MAEVMLFSTRRACGQREFQRCSLAKSAPIRLDALAPAQLVSVVERYVTRI